MGRKVSKAGRAIAPVKWWELQGRKLQDACTEEAREGRDVYSQILASASAVLMKALNAPDSKVSPEQKMKIALAILPRVGIQLFKGSRNSKQSDGAVSGLLGDYEVSPERVN